MGRENHQLSVVGMSCEHCRDTVEKALKGIPGVRGVVIDLETGTANVEADSGRVTTEDLVAAVEDAGYSAGTMSTP